MVATVGPAGATGTVQFKLDGANFGAPVPLNNGVARSSDMGSITRGARTIAAEYSGDFRLNPSSTSQSYEHPGSKSDSSTKLSYGVNSVRSYKAVTLVATVRPASANGVVQFKVDGKNAGDPVLVKDGVARSAALDLSGGIHTVEAMYEGSDYLRASSDKITVPVRTPPYSRR